MESQTLSLIIPKPLLEDAREIAARTGQKQSAVLRAALTHGMVGLRAFTHADESSDTREGEQDKSPVEEGTA